MRSVGCILVVLLVCGEAQAYSRSRDADNGVCLWWKPRMMTYFINETCSVDTQLSDCIAAVQAAFDTWNGYACTDMQIFYGGTTPRRDVGYEQSKTNNINLVVWLESDWQTHECPPDKAVCRDPRAIALTTTTYDTYTGQIVDTDIEANGEGFAFSTQTPTQVMDIHNTMAHEAGHTLGLDHSRDREATMWEVATSGEIQKRDLTQDDIDGLCFVYPAGESTPRYYLSGGNQILCYMDPPDDDCGCNTQQPGGLVLLLIGIGLLGHRTKVKGRQKS
jgi:hypothetical protein